MVFGVELGADEERMKFLVEFDGFDELAIRRGAGDDQPKFFQPSLVAVVKFIAMAMSFVN